MPCNNKKLKKQVRRYMFWTDDSKRMSGFQETMDEASTRHRAIQTMLRTTNTSLQVQEKNSWSLCTRAKATDTQCLDTVSDQTSQQRGMKTCTDMQTIKPNTRNSPQERKQISKHKYKNKVRIYTIAGNTHNVKRSNAICPRSQYIQPTIVKWPHKTNI